MCNRADAWVRCAYAFCANRLPHFSRASFTFTYIVHRCFASRRRRFGLRGFVEGKRMTEAQLVGSRRNEIRRRQATDHYCADSWKLGHTQAAYCVVFDRAGERVFTGADDNLIKVWGARNCLLMRTLKVSSAESLWRWPVRREAWRSAKAVATGRQMCTPSLYFISSFGRLAQQFARSCQGHRSEITDLAVHSAGKLLASASNDRTVRLWALNHSQMPCIAGVLCLGFGSQGGGASF